MSAAVAVKAWRAGPVCCKTLLEIPRSDKSKLVVELVQWDSEHPPVAKVLVMVQAHTGRWYVLPKNAGIRMSELKKVAVCLARAYADLQVAE